MLPDKIIIETMNRKDAGTWYSTGRGTILPIIVTDFELGKCVLNHLSQSKEEATTYEQIKSYWKELIKKAKYKTEKSFIQESKRVTITIDGDVMRLEPFKVNLTQKIFYRMPDGISEITPVPEASVIGKEVRRCWDKCVFVD